MIMLIQSLVHELSRLLLPMMLTTLRLLSDIIFQWMFMLLIKRVVIVSMQMNLLGCVSKIDLIILLHCWKKEVIWSK